MNRFSLTVYIFLNVTISIILIWTLGLMEPTINRTFFPNLHEAEVQAYMVGLGVFFLLQLVLYPMIKTTPAPQIRKPSNSTLFQLSIINISLVTGASLFVRSLLVSSQTQSVLERIHIYHSNNMNIWYFLLGEIIVFLTILYLVAKPPPSHRIKVFSQGVTILVILWLTLGLNKLNLYDYSNYAGPINDFRLGVPPVTSQSIYGFLPIVLLGILFKAITLTSQNLHLAIAVFNSFGYFVYYFFLYRILKDFRWAFIATLFAIFGKHLIGWGATYQIPQWTFIRLGMWVFVALALAFKSDLVKKLGRFGHSIPIIAVGITIFWSLDFGLYTVIAYCLYIFISTLNTNFFFYVKTTIKQLMQLISVIALLFISINAVYLLFYQTFPMWTNHYFSIFTILSTKLMVPVPNIPPLWGYILVFIVAISYLIYKKKQNSKLTDSESSVLFTAAVGLTTFNYFLGQSFINSITELSLPFYVCVFFLLKSFLRHYTPGTRLTILETSLIVATILSPPATLFAYQGIQNLTWANPISTIAVLNRTNPNAFDEQYWVGSTAKGLMNTYEQDIRSKNFMLLSTWNTWVLILWHATNKLNINCLICFYPEDKFDFVVNYIHKTPPKYLFVDSNRVLEYERVEKIFSHVKDQYQYIETIGFIDVYKRI